MEGVERPLQDLGQVHLLFCHSAINTDTIHCRGSSSLLQIKLINLRSPECAAVPLSRNISAKLW
jgi:hypothetical protein